MNTFRKLLTRKALFILSPVLVGLTMTSVAFALSSTSVVSPQPQVSAISVSGLDLHDGMVQKFGSTYYLYGTMYGCGFNWGSSSNWCGFGVSTAPSLEGPWSQPRQLFSPSARSPFRNMTWQQLCGNTGYGCFNPRMVVRDTWGPKDGVYILWFNAPADYAALAANAYYVMGCNGPTGGCGSEAGAPYGSTFKPPLYICGGNGDFSIVTVPNRSAYMVCTNANQTFSIEQLDYWGTRGINVGAVNLAGLSAVESPGIYKDEATGKWILTYSDPNCGYCAGNATSYATAPNVTGPYTAPANTGVAPDARGRRIISATSCGGQPRTVFTVDGQPYQFIDLWGVWNGKATNQTQAGVLFVPLNYQPKPAMNGGVLSQQFDQWPCS